jgi:hypothetical protein
MAVKVAPHIAWDESHVGLEQIAAEGALDDVERIASLTQKDRQLNSFAFRSFRDVADADYIVARMAYRAQLPMQFFWASQQAIEKYLKCILFIRRVPAKASAARPGRGPAAG